MPKLFRPFDIDFKSEKTYDNPFLDVELTGSFVHEETGEIITIPGFWKGGDVYTLRFAPTKVGRWNYVVESNEESLNTAGSFIACQNKGLTELDKRGFVRISQKGRYFEYADGTPFYWMGDTNWQAPDIARLDECNYPGCNCGSMFRHLVDQRKELGFNVFQTYPSAADNDGGGGKIYFWWKDKYTLIAPEAFNNNFDVKMDYLLKNGFTIALGIGVHSATPVMGADALCAFTKYMVARYAAYPVVWITGQEIDIPYLRKEEDYHEAWLKCAETISKYDGFNRPLGTHLYSREYNAERSCSPMYEVAPWHQYWALQAGHRREWAVPLLRPKKKYEDYWKISKKPMFETEAFYEDLRTSANDDLPPRTDHSHSTGYEVSRNAAWMSSLCGCMGYTYGAHGVWGMRWSKDKKDGGWCGDGSYNSEPWFMGIEKPFGSEVKYMGEFYNNIDFTKLEPQFYDTTYGEFSDKERVVMAVQGNELYALYIYGTEQHTGELKKLNKNSTYKAYWYDVRTGGYIKFDEFSGATTYKLPERPDKNDWVLLVTSKNINIPFEGSLYKSVALKKPLGERVKFTAFTSSTDNTTEVENIQNGKIWRPFAACASNIIKIDLGEETDLASVELLLEENKTGKYEYRIDGIKDGRVYVLCDRISEKTETSANFEKVEGTFRYLRIIFISEPEYIDEETRLNAGIEKLGVYRAYRKTEPPKVLNTITGDRVTDAETWETVRRDEVKNLCERYMYGIRDIEKPDDLYFNVEKTYEIYDMNCKEVVGGFGNFKFPFKLYLPKNADKPLPAFIYVAHENVENNMQFGDDGNMSWNAAESVLPLKYITDRGYAVAVMPTKEIYREWNVRANYEVGVFKEVNAQRTKYSWASISAWAWGVSRVLDFLETEPLVDETRVASIGHSRSGKAALWAAATDERIFLGVPNNSGCCGAAILRGKKGEHAKNINISDWFCPKFKEYNDCEDLLPMDQHFVLSLVAPRNLYVCDSILDEWADPDAELLACQLASPVWELYGKKGLIMNDEAPVLNKVYQEGNIAFHVKTGDHSQTMFDWENVINYFDKIK